MIRYDSPHHYLPRVALDDFELGGERVEAGDTLIIVMGAANRDPEVFDEPARFDITRRNAAEHLSFGFGAYFCLGAALARLEGEVVFETLVRRFPEARLLTNDITYGGSAMLRAIQQLPTELGKLRVTYDFMHSSDAVALTTATGSCTFAELDDRAARVAAGLAAAGLQPGDRVLAVLPNGQELIELLLGCARSCTVLVPVNWRLSPDEILAIAEDAGARAIVAGTDQPYETWLTEQHPDERAASACSRRRGAADLHVGNQRATQGRADHLRQSGRESAWRGAGVAVRAGRCELAGHADVPRRRARLGPGRPAQWCAHDRRRADPSRLSSRSCCGESGSRTPSSCPRSCRGFATLLVRTGFPDLRVVVYGAAPMSAATRTAVMDDVRLRPRARLRHDGDDGHRSPSTSTPHDDAATDVPCAGRPYPWIELTIRDPATCMALPAGSPGEIWTRSAQNTPGYAGDPVATRRLLTADGWLRTGDIGYLDDDGRLFVTDRLKELIITGGENVVPAEVESVLREHDDIADVAVVGLPDPRWGEVVTAVVVPRPGRTPTLDDVVAFSADRLVGYKRPRALHLVGELPRGMTGKVRKHALVEELSRDR